MPVLIESPDPAGLLQAIKEKIDDGDIHTWSYQGDRFEYLAAQYAGEAVLTADANDARLRFRLDWKAGATKKTHAIMAIYFGRFTEEVLSHFDKTAFTRLSVAPLR